MYSTPESPPRRVPSAWQTLFGKRQRESTADRTGAPHARPHERSSASSPPSEKALTIADQLLNALHARERCLEPEEELSQQCAEQLLGKRNAFVPELRMRSHSFGDEDHKQQQRQSSYRQQLSHDDMKAAAREIVESRFQIDRHADALRPHKNTPIARARADTKTARGSTQAASKIKATGSTAAHRTTRQSSAIDHERADTKHVQQQSAVPRALFQLAELEASTVKSDTKRTRTRLERTSRVATATAHMSKAVAVSSAADTDGIGSDSSARDSESSRPNRVRSARADPIKQMEARQQQLREARVARAATATAATSNTRQRATATSVGTRTRLTTAAPRGSTNQDDDTAASRHHSSRDQSAHSSPSLQHRAVVTADAAAAARSERLLQDKIERLVTENQRAAAVEDYLRSAQQQRQLKTRVFAALRKQLETRRQQHAHATQAFAWRLLLRTWQSWRQFAQAAATQRVERETQAKLVRAKLVAGRAEAFWRERQLPRWFYCWVARTQAAREARELECAQQRRKEQAQRLMERLIREQAAPTQTQEQQEQQHESALVAARELDALPAAAATEAAVAGRDIAVLGPKPTRSRHAAHTVHHTSQTRSASGRVAQKATVSSSDVVPATASPCDASPSIQHQSSLLPPSSIALSSSLVPPPPSTHPVDPLYNAMQERAAERKQRRDVLKQKYEQLEHEKREAVAMQVAEREAQLLERKLQERERVRERKRQEAVTAHAKALRLEALEAQWRAARDHSDQRLLYYYAFLPLQRSWQRSRRVTASAIEWHRLRTLHVRWSCWLEFVHDRRVERQRLEQQKLALAVKHRARALLRWSWRAFQLRHAEVLRTALAVERQVQWNALARSWWSWQRTFAANCSREYALVQRATRRLGAAKLQRAWMSWRLAASELRQERERIQEKEQLWRKVRSWLGESDAS